MRARALILLCMAAGCATAPVGAKFRVFEGGPVAAITERFGAPSSEATIAGAHWYRWAWNDVTCQISARVDERGIVLESHAEGTEFGCDVVMARRLK